MKVALINNGTKHLAALHELLRDYDVTDFSYVEADQVHGFDLIVLSGGSAFPILEHEGKLDKEIELIKTTTTPLIGICYGCELIAHSFGGTLKHLGDEVRGVLPVTVDSDDPMFDGKKEFAAYQAHKWSIASLPRELRILAHSEHGPEVIRHTGRLIWGFQFHPEVISEGFGAREIFNSLVRSIY